MLFYQTEEAQEGRDAFVQKRQPDLLRGFRAVRDAAGVKPKSKGLIWLEACAPAHAPAPPLRRS